MNHFNEEEPVESLPIDEIFRQFTKEHFSDSNQQENNNSFIFLEKSSLNLLLAYLLSKPQTASPSTTKITDELASKEGAWALKALEELDQFIHDNDKEFQDVLRLLQEIT